MLKSFEEVNSKVAALENTVSNLLKTVEALSQQEYARQPKAEPGAYDVGAEQLEQQHFEESSKESQEAIDAEHAIDLTTPAGRVSFKNRLLNSVEQVMNAEQPETNIYELEMSYNLGEESPEDFKDPAFKEYIEDGENKPDVSNDNVEVDVVNEDVKPEDNSEENKEEGDPELSSPFTDDGNEAPIEDKKIEDKPEKYQPKDDTDEDNKDKIVKLNEKDSKIFKKAICPICGESSLTKTKTAGIMVGVYCKDCSTEYAVNTENENIFHKISE
jgi:hypothetical protein